MEAGGRRTRKVGRWRPSRDQARHGNDTEEPGASRRVPPAEGEGGVTVRWYFVAPTIAHLRHPKSGRNEGFDRSKPEVEPDDTPHPIGCRRLPDEAIRRPLHVREPGSPC